MHKDTKFINVDLNSLEPEDLPDWFKKGCLDPLLVDSGLAAATYLNGLRQDVYSALSLFQVHVRAVITAMLSMITFLAAALSIFSKLQSGYTVFFVTIAASFILILQLPFALYSRSIWKRYYEVYIAALLQATQAHYMANVSGFWWFENTIKSVVVLKSENPCLTKQQFIMERTKSKRDSYYKYIRIAMSVGILGFIFGVAYIIVYLTLCI